MDLKKALAETYEERFSDDKYYLSEKLEKIVDCSTTSELLYFCMNLDDDGYELVGKKLQIPNFKEFVMTFRDLDQS